MQFPFSDVIFAGLFVSPPHLGRRTIFDDFQRPQATGKLHQNDAAVCLLSGGCCSISSGVVSLESAQLVVTV